MYPLPPPQKKKIHGPLHAKYHFYLFFGKIVNGFYLFSIFTKGSILDLRLMIMMMMMNCFCGMVDRRKVFSLISNRDHCQRSSPSWISDMPQAGFEPVQNLSSGFVEWRCAVVITTTPWQVLRMFWVKIMNDFFDEEHFCLHWNHSQIVKSGNEESCPKFQENWMTIIHINTFIKIGSINSLKSWLLVMKLVSWQICSISSNPPRKTLASTSWSPPLLRYLPLLQIFKKIYSFQYFFGRSCYHYQISHWNTAYKEATPWW